MKNTEFIDHFRTAINNHLDSILPGTVEPPVTIHKAMRYAVLSGGKRIRPIVTMLSAGMMGVDPFRVLDLGAAVELVHSSSLILDDLPVMDNSGLRRGVKSTHLVFSEDVAVLSSIALLAMAFELVADFCEKEELPQKNSVEILRVLSRTIGSKGLTGGQIDDLQTSREELDMELLKSIHLRKTGSLFSASAILGVMAAGGSDDDIAAVKGYTEDLGLAFQIVDDIMDLESSSQVTGKEGNKDRDGVSFVNFVDVATARKMAEDLHIRSVANLERFGNKADRLVALADYLLNRRF